MGLDVFSPAESPKSVLTPFLGANHSTRTVAVLSTQGRTVSGQGLDGPRPGAGLGFPACQPDGPCPGAERSVPWGRTVRACAGAAKGHRLCLDLAPRRDPVGEERS
jgi:hypothetical protein